MLDKDGSQLGVANIAGIDFHTLSTIEKVRWIIDTGATNHMSANLGAMSAIDKVPTLSNQRVYLPNGGIILVTHRKMQNWRHRGDQECVVHTSVQV